MDSKTSFTIELLYVIDEVNIENIFITFNSFDESGYYSSAYKVQQPSNPFSENVQIFEITKVYNLPIIISFFQLKNYIETIYFKGKTIFQCNVFLNNTLISTL